ncbi:DUF5696 domain-containing protein [Paenibacillus castaneae]|uniref:DUF5696 domain-containing protein n=1 Tax=Paenibacillus castaneae TaxID=474957 RepID=UPI000C9CC1A9|nr:DUF5696 domain-containing protein [Paenibacillus castaneae]
MRAFGSRRMLKIAAASLVAILMLTSLVFAEPLANKSTEDSKNTEQIAEGVATAKIASPFLNDGKFKPVVESKYLSLQVNADTGHFIVTDKRNGNVWKSFPDEDGYIDAENQGAWKSNLESPFMFNYVEFNVRRDLTKESNFKDQGGVVTGFEVMDNGYRLTYELPNLGFFIPVEVRLYDDYVETKILKDGLIDEKVFPKEEEKSEEEGKAEKKPAPPKDNKARLVSVRLFPFLGAQTSDREDGYLLIPDGPGTLIDFKKHRGGDNNNFYSESVYGNDWAFSVNNSISNRNPVKMPVFGIKSGEQAILGVIQEGAEYASILAAPSGTFSQYNWTTAEQNFRFKYYVYTNTKKTTGYVSYTKDLTATDRSIRYYLIDKKNSDYAQMAARYRQYLIEDAGVQPLKAEGDKVPLQLNLFGADTEKGFLWDSYLPLTTTSQAREIVQEISSLGVDKMSITYWGWQRKGNSQYGGSFPLASKFGGNDGMKQFVDFAHSKGYPVYLDGSSYTYNNTGKDGFRRSRDGLRDIGSAIIDFTSWGSNDKTTFASPGFMEKVISKDLNKAKALNVDGFIFGQGIGAFLNSDFNDNYSASRSQAEQIQEQIFQKTKDTLGSVQVASGNFYTLPYVNHIHGLYDDYSYDMFVDRIIPFAQIALHGIVTYSADFANVSGDYQQNFLRGIEYGAVPSFVVTYAKSQELLKSKSLRNLYSTYYKDWLQEMVSQYQRYNEALGDVQDQFITDHRMLAEGVYETTYAAGKRVIVNYNSFPYVNDGIAVKATDFTVIKD